MPWKCPECGREFRNKNQWHSCSNVNPEIFFKNRPLALKKAFDKIIRAVVRFGNVNVSAVQTSIQVKSRSTFIGIRAMKDHLKVEFWLRSETKEFPVYKSVRFSKNRIVHCVALQQPREVNKQLLLWLRESYEIVSATK